MSGTAESMNKPKERSINISVCGRTYPLMVKLEDEATVNEAIKLIQDTITGYEKNYAIKDKQDLLAMSVLHFAVKSVSAKPLSVIDEDCMSKLATVSEKLDNYLAV